MAAWEIPTAWAPIVGRDRSSVAMAMRKPSPSAPIMFEAGTRTSSNSTSPVGEPRTPIFFSSLPTLTPQSASTTNAEMPRCPAEGSVLANTVYRSEMPALVIQYLVPFNTHESPSRTARVFMAATSDPASGSDRQYEHCDSPDATRGRYRAFNSSEPQFMTGIIPSFEMSMMRLVDAQARDSSSTMIAWVT